MMAQLQSLTVRTAWKALAAHHRSVRNVHLRELIAHDIRRGERLTLEAPALLDYSKNRATNETILLLRPANECGLAVRIDAMFNRGENQRERAACGAPCRAARFQGGVELGKVLAQRIVPELESTDETGLERDSSTSALIRPYRRLRNAHP